MKSYKELEAWKKGRSLVKRIYQMTKQLPDDEKFRLISQMRKCVVSATYFQRISLWTRNLCDFMQWCWIYWRFNL